MPDVIEISCDEAGHTGPDLLDADQRYFSYASVSINDDEAWDIIEKARRANPVQMPELKGAKLMKTGMGKSGAAWRLPASEVECVVVDGLVSFLGDKSRLIGAVRMAGASPAMLKTFFQDAESLAKKLTDGPGTEKKVLLQKLVRRITIEQDKVQVIVRGDYLTSLAGQPDTEKPDAYEERDTTIVIPVSFRRRAHGEKLIIAVSSAPTKAPDHQLIRAVALGHAWFREMRDGTSVSLTELARRDDIERTDAGRFLRLAFLAPDIVKAILDGSQPGDLTFRWMKRLTDLPLSWEEQRKVLGFTS